MKPQRYVWTTFWCCLESFLPPKCVAFPCVKHSEFAELENEVWSDPQNILSMSPPPEAESFITSRTCVLMAFGSQTVQLQAVLLHYVVPLDLPVWVLVLPAGRTFASAKLLGAASALDGRMTPTTAFHSKPSMGPGRNAQHQFDAWG